MYIQLDPFFIYLSFQLLSQLEKTGSPQFPGWATPVPTKAGAGTAQGCLPDKALQASVQRAGATEAAHVNLSRKGPLALEGPLCPAAESYL